MPPHSTRITLVNDVNFLLYTPFLPEAAAGTLEPRHVVTPLRDVLKETRLRMGAVVGRDGARRTVTYRDQEGAEHELRYDRLVVAHGSVSRVLPIPGLAEHAVGFKSLADAIWLRNHVINCLEIADESADDAALRGAAQLRVRRAADTPGWRRWPSCRTSPPRRCASTRARACTACAGSWSRRPTASCSRSSPSWPTTPAASCAGAGSTSGSATTLEEVTANSARLSTGETIPARTVVWTAGVVPHPSVKQPRAAARRARARSWSTTTCWCEGEQDVWAVGDCAAVPDPAKRGRRPRPPTSQHAIRQGRTAGRNVAASLGVGPRTPVHATGRAGSS